MDIQKLKEILTTTFFEFSREEKIILEQDAHEESISCLLIKYIEKGFHEFPFNVNSQYDKRIVDDKVVKKKVSILTERIPKSILSKKVLAENPLIIDKLVRPDIILHDITSSDNNFLVIEIKKSANKNNDEKEFDHLKLQVFTGDDLCYEYGVFVEFRTGKEYDIEKPFFYCVYYRGQKVDCFYP